MCSIRGTWINLARKECLLGNQTETLLRLGGTRVAVRLRMLRKENE